MIRFITQSRSGLNIFQQRPGLGIAPVLLIVLLMTSCSSDQDDTGPTSSAKNSPSPQAKVVNKEGNYITATPNPVSKTGTTGKTTVSWGTKGIPGLDVHVVIFAAGQEQGLFATGSVGSQEAPWISQPTEFRLYQGSGSDKKLLDTVTVTLEGAK